MDERDYFNATNPCLARPDRHRRIGLHRIDRPSLVRRLIAKLVRR